MRVLLAECKQEVSSFNPVAGRYADFQIDTGDALADYHRGLNTELGGAIDHLTQRSVPVVPAVGIRGITSGGTVAQADYERLAGAFLHAIEAAVPVDAVYLSLHGAMASDLEPDPEGYLLEQTRRIVGSDVPIVASFDLHGILTSRILKHADAIVAYHTYPHVDFHHTGERAARLLLRLASREVRPVTAVVRIPALVRGDELITETGLFGRIIAHARSLEAGTDAQPAALSAGAFIGNPFTDVPDLCSSSFVVTDGDADRARTEATGMAEELWAHRARMQQPLTSLEEAVAIAGRTTGTIILTDAADATSSGASGDSNAILRALVESRYQARALVPVVDPGAVQDAVRAGVGATIHTTVGGSLDPARFTPLPVEAKVRMISDGDIVSESNAAVWQAGTSAVLQAGPHTVIATSRPVSLFDRSLFLAHGLDPRRFDAVVVKSPHCQPHMFSEWAARIVNVDAPGSTSANLKSLGHTRCRRPIFPLDTDVSFHPHAEVYTRR